MFHYVSHFNHAQNAWLQWNSASFSYKNQHIQTLKAQLNRQNKRLGKLINFHLQHAQTRLAEPISLIGITGECNELYTSGRGVCLIVVENASANTENRHYNFFAMLIAAMIAGNSVIICSDYASLNEQLSSALRLATLPSNLIQLMPYDAFPALLENDISTVAYVGNNHVLQQIDKLLADKKGAIPALVFETHLAAPTLMHDPLLSLRFITERTRTINTTAIGGNASLLALSLELC